MTALCGGGTSAPKLGAAAFVDYSAGALALALSAILGPQWIPLIALIGLAPIGLTSFCATDPPAMVALTQAEADALLQLTLGADFTSGLAKLPAIFQNAIWNDQCICTSGTYTPPVAPALPAGSVTFIYPSLAAAPCGTQSATIGQLTQGQSFGFTTGLDFASKNVTGAQLVTTITDQSGGPTGINGTVRWFAPDHITTVRADTFRITGPGTWTFNFSPAPGATFVQPAGVIDAAPNVSLTHNSTWSLFCNGQGPATPVQPCCPPDSATLTTLNAILDTVRSMQRNYAPFAYVISTAHPGLTGTTSVPVSRLLGVKIQITAFPAADVILPGNPPYIKDLGWMSVSEVDGMIQERRVTQSLFTWFPPHMALADHVNFGLNPGVTATFTELKPEP